MKKLLLFSALAFSLAHADLHAEYLSGGEIQVIGVPDTLNLGVSDTIPAAELDVAAVGGCQFEYPAENLLVYLAADENSPAVVEDVSGNGNFLQGADVGFSVPGAVGGCMIFSANSSLSGTGPAFPPKSSLTIAFWIQQEKAPDAEAELLNLGTPGGNGMRMALTPKGLLVVSGGDSIETELPAPPLAAWRHIAVTIEDKITVYVDGKELDDQNNPGITAPAEAAVLTIGQALDRPSFEGALDEFRIYAKALKEEEIKALVALKDAQPAVYYSETTRTDSNDNDLQIIERTWTGTDSCGKSNTETQTIFKRMVPKNTLNYPTL